MTREPGAPTAPRKVWRGWMLPRDQHDLVRLAAGVAVLVAASLPVERGRVGGLERSVFDAINGLPAFLWPVMWVVMQLGNLVAIPVAAILALVRGRRRLTFDLLVAGTGAYLLVKLVKTIVVRARPGAILDRVVLHGAPAEGSGYPSGHVALAAALATAASPYLSTRGRIAAWSIVGIVMVARIYVGAHLPLDAVGGAGLGVALGALVHVLFGAPAVHERGLLTRRRRPAASPPPGRG
ncbi:MAG TPA: phosphatase PAP2 family protein [Actinomycetota bacterium]|nr:phosphatase PAP2 family protein [Actinomycetota bacterium]